MIQDYIKAALAKAHYEIIEDEEPYYGEIPELQGVWATGRTLEECRQQLEETLEGWILIRNSQGLDTYLAANSASTTSWELPRPACIEDWAARTLPCRKSSYSRAAR